MCCICNKTFALHNMGKSAVENHMQCEEHKQNTCSESFNVNSFFKRATSIATPSSSVSSQSHVCAPAQETALSTEVSCTPKKAQKITYVQKRDVLKAEVCGL